MLSPAVSVCDRGLSQTTMKTRKACWIFSTLVIGYILFQLITGRQSSSGESEHRLRTGASETSAPASVKPQAPPDQASCCVPSGKTSWSPIAPCVNYCNPRECSSCKRCVQPGKTSWSYCADPPTRASAKPSASAIDSVIDSPSASDTPSTSNSAGASTGAVGKFVEWFPTDVLYGSGVSSWHYDA